MILILHIIIALGSLVWATFNLIAPSRQKTTGSFVLIGLTIASGTALALSQPVSILHLCVAGLTYTSLSLALTFIASHKLAHQS